MIDRDMIALGLGAVTGALLGLIAGLLGAGAGLTVSSWTLYGRNPETPLGLAVGVGTPLIALTLLWYAARRIHRYFGLGFAIAAAWVMVGFGMCQTALLFVHE